MRASERVNGSRQAGRLEATHVPASWRRLLDAVPAAVLIVAPDGTIRYANSQLERVTGYRRAELAWQPVEILVPDGMRQAHARAREGFAEASARRPMGAGLDIWCRRADGSVFPADISLSPLEVGAETFVVATVADETERRRDADELFHRAQHDPLTGLANRVLLGDRLERALARTVRPARSLAVLYVDLDGFKAVNDTWRHAVGDEVLRIVAQRLASAVRPEDTVARFGGDEFVVLCEDLGAPADAVRVAERILAEVRRPVPHRKGTCELSASIGVVLSGGGANGPALIEAADHAMFRAKRRGGAAVQVSQAVGPSRGQDDGHQVHGTQADWRPGNHAERAGAGPEAG